MVDSIKLFMKFWKLEDREDRLRAIKALMEGKAVAYGLEIKGQNLQLLGPPEGPPNTIIKCRFS